LNGPNIAFLDASAFTKRTF